MCQTCYDRGYKDYPNWVGSAPHPDYYQKGFNAHQAETGEAGHYAESVDFCETCYDRGYEDGIKDYWSPPTTPKSGHKESYKEGFNSVKAKRDEKERQEEEYRRQRQREQQRERQQYTKQPSSQTSSSNENAFQELLSKVIVYGLAAAAIIWLVFKVALPLILINIATIALIAGLSKRDWSKSLFPLSILGAIYFVLDLNNRWATQALVTNVSFFKGAIPLFFYLNIAAGLVAAYFLIRDYLNEKTPPVENGQEFSKRNLSVMGSLFLLGGLTIGGQKYFDLQKNGQIQSLGITAPISTKEELNLSNPEIFVGDWYDISPQSTDEISRLTISKGGNDFYIYEVIEDSEGNVLIGPNSIDMPASHIKNGRLHYFDNPNMFFVMIKDKGTPKLEEYKKGEKIAVYGKKSRAGSDSSYNSDEEHPGGVGRTHAGEEEFIASTLNSTVSAKRAYFYDIIEGKFEKRNPELFIIRGDKVTILNVQNGYANIKYSTRNGEDVTGWLLESDLQAGRFPQGSERLLSENEFSGLSKENLKIMRNEIFARHGYIFKTPEMKSYFEAQPWYHGQYDDVTSMLSEIEKQNVELIKKHE